MRGEGFHALSGRLGGWLGLRALHHLLEVHGDLVRTLTHAVGRVVHEHGGRDRSAGLNWLCSVLRHRLADMFRLSRVVRHQLANWSWLCRVVWHCPVICSGWPCRVIWHYPADRIRLSRVV